MPSKTHRPLPHERVIEGATHTVDPKYLEVNDEPMSVGSASNARKIPKEQADGYQDDVTLDWQAIVDKLAAEGFRLNTDCTLEYITNPDFPKGIQLVPGQLLRRDKAYAGVLGRRQMIGVLQSPSLNDYQQKIARCLYNPSLSKFDLKALGKYVEEWKLPNQEVGDRNWRGEANVKYDANVPRKMIPAASQFPDGVRALEFGDIFTLFTGAALEQFKLFLGRVIVGHSGTIDPFTKQKLRHTYRNICVIDGKFAGQGKTQLFSILNSALERVGYNVHQSCPNLAGRFNHHDAFTSDFIFEDDSTPESLSKDLSSSHAKVLATNGFVITEQKGVDAIATKTKAAMLYLSNRVDQRLFWGMDDGMRSRVTLIATEAEGSIPPERLPLAWFEHLTAKLNVDAETLMLWACRLAADEFAKYTNENSHLLEFRVKELADQANNTSADPLDGTLAALVLGHYLETGVAPPKNINKDVLVIGLKGMLALKQNPEVAKLLGDTANIPAWSPAQGLKWINPSSVRSAQHVLQTGGVATTENKLIKAAMESLSLRDGNQCYGNPSVVLPRWTELVGNTFTLNRIKELYDILKVSYTPDFTRVKGEIDYSLDYFYNS